MSADGEAWLPATARVIALAGRPDDHRDPDSVAEAAKVAARFVEGAAARSSRERVEAFQNLVTEFGGRPNPVLPQLFDLFAYQPKDVLESFAPHLEGGRRWSTLVEIHQAWIELAGERKIPQVSVRGQRVALAYLIRTRWYLLSAAFTSPDETWLSPKERLRLDGKHAAAVAARQAREEWLAVLDNLEDHPMLARDIDDPVAEALRVMDCRLDASTLTGDPPAGEPPGRPVPAGPNPVDADVMRHMVRAHLLPRFVLGTSWRIAWRLSPRLGKVATCVAGLMFVLAIVAVVTGLAGWLPRGTLYGAGAAAAGYAAIVTAGLLERSASWPWLLRQPASAGVGILVLVTLNDDWWTGSTTTEVVFAVVGSLVLLAVGAGYLMVEAVNHGVRQLRRRVAAVAGMGLLHATLVTAIGLTVVLPALAQNGAPLAQCWTVARCGADGLPPWLLFSLSTAWSFAAGVFTQILWDDQPFTAPLAHLRWRTGR